MTRMSDVIIDTTDFVSERGVEPRGLAVWGFRPAGEKELGEEPGFEFYGTYGEASKEAKKHYAKLGVLEIAIYTEHVGVEV